MRLLPELQRWLALTEQLATMLSASRDIANGLAKRLPEVAGALEGSAHAFEGGTNAGEATDSGDGGAGREAGAPASDADEVGEDAPWAARELLPAIRKFDSTLEAAIPNLVVAKPWLSELIKPLQRSLHAIVDHAKTWRDPESAASASRGSRGRLSGSRDNTPSPPRHAQVGPRGQDVLMAGTAPRLNPTPTTGHGERGGGAMRLSASMGALPATGEMLGSGDAADVGSGRARLFNGSVSVASLDFGGVASLQGSATMPSTCMPSRAPLAATTSAMRAYTMKPAARSLQQTLPGRKPPSKLPPNAFLPGAARSILAASGDAHFARS